MGLGLPEPTPRKDGQQESLTAVVREAEERVGVRLGVRVLSEQRTGGTRGPIGVDPADHVLAAASETVAMSPPCLDS
jgi:hypothetical protein